jgi:hypothetical protein
VPLSREGGVKGRLCYTGMVLGVRQIGRGGGFCGYIEGAKTTFGIPLQTSAFLKS